MTDCLDKLLLIESDQAVGEHTKTVAQLLKYKVASAASRTEVEDVLSWFTPSVVLMDLKTIGKDAAKCLKLLQEQVNTARVIFAHGTDVRALATTKHIGEILGIHVTGTLQKPVTIDALRHALNKSRRASYAITAADIDNALTENEIKPVYQPKATRLANGEWRITEVEALARWFRQDAKTVLPSEFVGVAERSSLLPRMTQVMLEQVVDQLSGWDKCGLHLNAAINLTPTLLTNRAFPDELEKKMRAKKLANSRLTLELTESAAMQNPNLAVDILTALRDKGFGLSIDDFGTGYSSLEKLYRLPFNELKVDRFLVREIGIRADADTIVEAIVMLGHKLGLEVCAEGVESRAALDFLCDLGCDKLQGYYVGRPTLGKNLPRVVAEFGMRGFARAQRQPSRETFQRGFVNRETEPMMLPAT